MPRSSRLLAFVLAVLVPSGCYVVRAPTARPLVPDRETDDPVKVQMLDGSIVLFRAGAVRDDRTIEGDGRHFDLALDWIGDRASVPMDSVAGVLVLRGDEIDGMASWLLTMMTGVGLLGVLLSFMLPYT